MMIATLQRRVLRLLLQHNETLFHQKFRLFLSDSALPQIPLLQQYDRYLKLRVLSNELLDDILPRIRRQLSLKTSHARLREEAPTRGDIDWHRTVERNWSQAPGLPPLQFETRLRQRTLDTPENLLVVAILLAYRREIQLALSEQFSDETFSTHERQWLVSADERAERELAAAYARSLTEDARHVDCSELAQHVSLRLPPGPGPYRTLLAWWHQFSAFRVGRSPARAATTLTSKREDARTEAWLYELWIMLEMLHLLQQAEAIEPNDVRIASDNLQCLFSWRQRRFRLLYNRQLDTSTSYESDWEHGPRTRPDYTIERAEPLEIRHVGELLWREPPVVLDAKYYLPAQPTESEPDMEPATEHTAYTHLPLKKLLGDMTLLGARVGALFFPLIPEPQEGQQITRTIRRTGRQYNGEASMQVHLLHLDPLMPIELLQERLRAVLNLASEQLVERPAPVCQGIALDTDTVNASNSTIAAQTILCPKPHIGPGIFDLVNVETDCLKNPRLCHAMGQAIVPPFVLRVITQEQLEQQCHLLRTRGNELLQAAEQAGDEVRAERIREQLFSGIGQAVEQYIKLFGNTKSIEDNFENWVFSDRWKQHAWSLAQETRRSLLSGEHIWQNYESANTLQDWAAPAIQYCRTLEFELQRRLYKPCLSTYPPLNSGFTLGTITHAYLKHGSESKAARIWQIFQQLVTRSGSDFTELETWIHTMCTEEIRQKRNTLAHGDTVTKESAASLRSFVVGSQHKPGILCWLTQHLAPDVVN